MFEVNIVIIMVGCFLLAFIGFYLAWRKERKARIALQEHPRLIRLKDNIATFSSLPNNVVAGEPIALSAPSFDLVQKMSNRIKDAKRRGISGPREDILGADILE